jgi:hypothetical protein
MFKVGQYVKVRREYPSIGLCTGHLYKIINVYYQNHPYYEFTEIMNDTNHIIPIHSRYLVLAEPPEDVQIEEYI